MEIEEIIKNIDEGIIILDKNNEIILINDKAKNLIGSDTEKITKSLEEFTNLEMEIDSPYPHIIDATKKIIKNEKGEKINSVITLRDITKKKEEESIKMDFVSTISHQLKAPLTTIKNVVEILLSGEAGKILDAQEYLLRMANTSIEKILRITADLLELSEIEKLNLVPVNVVEIMDEVLQIFELQAKQKNITTTKEYGKEEYQIFADKVKVNQIFINIIDNAIKFNKSGGKITIKIEKEGEYVKTSIYDTGCGMSKQEIDKIFDKFYQVKKIYKERKGLGLAIVKKIVEQHHGKLKCESEIEKGSVFHIYLPSRPLG